MRRLFGRGESGSEAYLHHGGGLFVRLGLGGRLAREDLVHRGKRVDALEESLPVRVNGAGTVSGFLGVVLGSFSVPREEFRVGARRIRPGKRTAPSRRTWRRNRTPPPSATRRSAPRRARASPSSASSERERGVSLRARGGKMRERRVNNERKSLARRSGKRTCMPSRAKLIPSAGSGSSGGTSSAGSCTSHVPSGLPYRHRFSLSGSDCE